MSPRSTFVSANSIVPAAIKLIASDMASYSRADIAENVFLSNNLES